MANYNLQQWYRDVAVQKDYLKATLYYQLPYAIARFKKRIEEVSNQHPKGTYFKLVKNE